MDCIEWIHLPQHPEESIHLWMNDLYEQHSIYRTILVCRNKAHLKEIYHSLRRLDVPICVLRSIWDLRSFESSSYRILLITFDQYFYHGDVFQMYIYKNHYCIILQELFSLQEQYCLQKIYQALEQEDALEKYYITIH